MALARITLPLAAARLYPPNAAFMARTVLEQTQLIGYQPYNLDTVTTLLLGLLNGLATVRHRSGVTEAALDLFDRAGVDIEEDMRVYESGEEAERHADGLIAEGRKLLWPYPLRANRFPEDAHLVPPALWGRLNAKQSLDRLVPAAHLAPRRMARAADLAGVAFERPVYVKAGGETPNGGGFGVRYCGDAAAWNDALAWFQAHAGEDIVVEEALSVETCWCAAIAVGASQTAYLGAAEQVFSAPGRQSGSIIDAANPLPQEGAALAVMAGEAARKLGFVGIAGLDIGLTSDGTLMVFDPNFRFNASSAQVLMHDSAARRGGFSASVSTHAMTPLRAGELARKLRAPIDDGWYVPTRLVDGGLLPTTGGKSVCSGFVLGRDRADALARSRELDGMLTA